MTTKSRPWRQASKSTFALFVVAAALTAGAVMGRGPGAALPDPEEMALLANGRATPAENVSFWQGKVAERPHVAEFRTALASAQLALARGSGDLDLYERAETEAARAVDLLPTSEPARLALAASLSAQHRFDEALDLADAVLVDDPTSVAALLAAGDAHIELGNIDDAETAYRRAVGELGGDTPATLSRSAKLSALRGAPEQAVSLAQEALIGAADIDLPLADASFFWTQLAHYRFQIGDLDGAESALRSALAIQPEGLGATEQLGRVLAAQHRDAEAIAVYEGLITRTPAADLHGELAKLYQRVGRVDDAAAQIEAGLELAREMPDRYPAERRHLISFLADHDPQEALRLAELDLASRQDVHSHAWYAWALLQTGRAQEALDAIGPALATGIDEPWVRYQAGAIYAANGLEAEAEEMLTAALDRNPEFDVVHADRARSLR